MSIFLAPEGSPVPPAALTIPRARNFVTAICSGRLPYVALVDCLQVSDDSKVIAEIAVFDVEVERPQQLEHDIRRMERLAVRFESSDSWNPEVRALRSDFPRVPHLNLTDTEIPRSLCLYDQPWSQIAMRWTPAAFVERIRFWLAETSKGSLHQDDQPLEPLLFGGGYRIILPPGCFDGESPGDYQELKVSLAYDGDGCRTLIAEQGQGAEGMPFLALSFVARPQTHGVIRHAPGDLRELDEFLKAAGINLIDSLRRKLLDWNQPGLLDKRLLIVAVFPLLRSVRASVESTDTWVFLTMKTLAELGIAIGRWEKSDYGLGTPIVSNPAADGSGIPLDIVSPHFDLTRAGAAAASNLVPDPRPAIAIGAGALGSHTLRLLVQSGFGRWCVIDDDLLLPHNLARHALDRREMGLPKAPAVARLLRRFYKEEKALPFVEADVLSPGRHRDEVEEQLRAAELVLDVAASVPVSRYLAHEAPGQARRVALFLNPRGTDLVLLAEDVRRSLRLDSLEMQYYRALCRETELRDHLALPPGRLRYARSCRDVSSKIPNHLVAMHAAIGAWGVRQALKSDAARIQIWSANPDTLEVQYIEVLPSFVHRNAFGDWTLVVDGALRERMSELRASKLPSETGGVLVGSYDLNRKIIYVVETIPSPPDSEEWPTLYIRGKKGLAARVQEIVAITDGQLEYVGEWHSHPDKCACLPSDDDLKVFGWLTDNMRDAGLPALMAIAGQGPVVAWYLGEMHSECGWEIGR